MNLIMKKYLLFCGILSACALIPSISGAPGGRAHPVGSTTYDQKQSGKYNIHLNIKDVAIIAVGSESLSGGLGDAGSFYEDYYDYDVNDFTISPISAALGVTTKKPKPHNVTSIQDILNISASKPQSTVKPSLLMVVSGLTEDTDSPDQIDDDENLEINFELASNNQDTSSSAPVTKPTENPEQKPQKPLVVDQVQSGKPIANKTQSVVILSDFSDANKTVPLNDHKLDGITISSSSFSTESSVPSISSSTTIIEEDGSQIPVHIIMEPVLHPKVRPSNSPAHRLNHRIRKNGAVGGELIDQANASARRGNASSRVKARRNTQYNEARRCGRNQVLDRQGRCQSRRSGL